MHILILGGGINGAALARELAGRGCSVTLVDRRDLASGATSASSRLIHGGLRYLEYREFDLVREALGERRWLLEAAPHLVRPLKLFIPLTHRTSGLVTAATRFLGFNRSSSAPAPPRGLWAVRSGLTFYDWYSRGGQLPRHSTHTLSHSPPSDLPRVADDYRWLCAYYDGQVPYAERLVVEFLEDAGRLAQRQNRQVTVHTYCDARLLDGQLQIRRRDSETLLAEHDAGTFDAIVNATGAWVDQTLERLAIPSRRLMGGTKGSHIWVDHPGLQKELDGRGIYAEAEDGRVVFVLPFGRYSMIGTTDVPFEGDPEEARATEEERQYLLDLLRRVFPQFALEARDVVFHYSGVRPLPYRDWTGANPSAVTRSHSVVAQDNTTPPVVSLVGGKLTTCRALAKDAADFLAHDCKLALPDAWPVADGDETVDRNHKLPGGQRQHQADNEAQLVDRVCGQLEGRGLNADQARAHWSLFGTRAVAILSESNDAPPALLADSDVTLAAVRHCVLHEWVETLGDLVERRLMLLYHQRLTRATLHGLAEVLVQTGKLASNHVTETVAEYERDLEQRLGLTVNDKESIR